MGSATSMNFPYFNFDFHDSDLGFSNNVIDELSNLSFGLSYQYFKRLSKLEEDINRGFSNLSLGSFDYGMYLPLLFLTLKFYFSDHDLGFDNAVMGFLASMLVLW